MTERSAHTNDQPYDEDVGWHQGVLHISPKLSRGQKRHRPTAFCWCLPEWHWCGRHQRGGHLIVYHQEPKYRRKARQGSTR